ncbi:MAG: sensor histidine kinase [Christensenellales bacterium]
MPVFVLIAIIYTQQIGNTVQSFEKWASAKIDQIYYHAEKNLSIVEKTAAQMIYGNNLQYYMTDTKGISDSEWSGFVTSYQNKVMSLRYAYNELFYKISLYSDSFKQREIDGYIYDIERLKDLSEYESIISGSERTFCGNVSKTHNDSDEFSKTNGSWIVPYYYKVYSPHNNAFIGVIKIDVLASKLLDHKNINLDENDTYFVYGDNGYLLYEKNEDGIVSSVDIDKIATDKGVLDIDGKYIAYECFEKLGFKVFIGINKSDLTDIMQNQRLLLVWLLFFASILVIFLVWLIINLMFKRLKNLVKIIENVEQGDFNLHLEDRGNDEISIIIRRFNEMAKKLKENIENAIQKETAHKEAELKALQLQINPHFMYNVLENLRMQCEIKGDSEMADTLISLADFFRYSIKNQSEIVTLETEMNHLENYIAIMKFRYQDKLVLTENINTACYHCRIPKVSLQPIVENCFRHAFTNKQSPWKISISTEVNNDTLLIIIQDNGQGISPKDLARLNDDLQRNKTSLNSPVEGNPIGFHNVNSRIKMLFGDQFGIRLESRVNIGTKVSIVLPFYIENKEVIYD